MEINNNMNNEASEKIIQLDEIPHLINCSALK